MSGPVLSLSALQDNINEYGIYMLHESEICGAETQGPEPSLAIMVDDHDLDYIDFEGTIEDGYGAGTVEIWDGGECEVVDANDRSMSLVLHGERMRGSYKLMHWKEDNWLLFKLAEV
jgi:hypothetical protein